MQKIRSLGRTGEPSRPQFPYFCSVTQVSNLGHYKRSFLRYARFERLTSFRRTRVFAKLLICMAVSSALSRFLKFQGTAELSSRQRIRFLSIDFHISPIQDLKALVKHKEKFNHVVILDESLSSHCHLTSTCARHLPVINRENGLNLGECPNEMKYNFWRRYADSQALLGTDVFICQHAFSLCELYMPFQKPMVLIASTRYEIGRLSTSAWNRLNKNIVAMASRDENTIAANNMYDAEYLKHFTGLKDVPVIINTCMYVGSHYNPTLPEILIGPSRLSKGGRKLLRDMLASLKGSSFDRKLSFIQVRTAYKHYRYKDLSAHPAILLIPYQVSIMSFFEYYAMSIPMFAPSLELLVRWQTQYQVLDELSWNCVENRCAQKSSIAAHVNSPHWGYDPNDIMNSSSLRHWLNYSDIYQFPGIVHFDSWQDLFKKVQESNLAAVSRIMRKYHAYQLVNVEKTWQGIFKKVGAHRSASQSHVQYVLEGKGRERSTWEAHIQTQYPALDAATYKSTC